MMDLTHSALWRTTRSLPRAASATDSAHLGQLLHLLADAFEQRTLQKCHQRGHRKFRNSHSAVIAELCTAGTSLGDLAERIGISQQATGKLVRDLERAGYVDSHLDTHDRRSRVIQLTTAGTLLQRDVAEILREINDEFVEIIGESGMRSFERQLRHAASTLTQTES